jgi:probable selenium-dependent hydroxylase accessory protein YqeC
MNAEATDSLIRVLEIGAREHIAIVGAGGKSALMFALAEELGRAGKKVVTSTTTKVWNRQAQQAPCVVCTGDFPSWEEEVRAMLEGEPHIFVGRGVLESGKMDGPDASELDRFFQGEATDYLIVEADGAAGLPVKAPAEHEPVIPASATLVVAVMGIEAIGRSLLPEEVFRPEAMKKITGLKAGEILTSKALARLFLDPQGLFKGTPASAERIAFLNKLDLFAKDDEAMSLAQEILGSSRGEIRRVVAGSVREGKYRVIQSRMPKVR